MGGWGVFPAFLREIWLSVMDFDLVSLFTPFYSNSSVQIMKCHQLCPAFVSEKQISAKVVLLLN